MKRMIALYASAASLILMAACDASGGRNGEDTSSSDLVVEDLSAEHGGGFTTSTPEGVIAPTPQGKFVDQSYIGDSADNASNEAGILACHVDLLFCRDSRFGNRPSGCTNGGCTITQAHNAASSLCRSVCGNIDCNTIFWPAGCL